MLVERVRKTIADWAAAEGWDDLPVCELERPAQEAHGDYATPFCMQMAKAVRQPPRALAERLCERLLADPDLAQLVEKIDIAGPGFINFTLSGQAFSRAMEQLLAEGERIGAGAAKDHPRINLEFVSVNPNGPLHVGHGRYAAYGDALCRLAEVQRTRRGHRVLHKRLRPADGPVRPQRSRPLFAVVRRRAAGARRRLPRRLRQRRRGRGAPGGGGPLGRALTIAAEAVQAVATAVAEGDAVPAEGTEGLVDAVPVEDQEDEAGDEQEAAGGAEWPADPGGA